METPASAVSTILERKQRNTIPLNSDEGVSQVGAFPIGGRRNDHVEFDNSSFDDPEEASDRQVVDSENPATGNDDTAEPIVRVEGQLVDVAKEATRDAIYEQYTRQLLTIPRAEEVTPTEKIVILDAAPRGRRKLILWAVLLGLTLATLVALPLFFTLKASSRSEDVIDVPATNEIRMDKVEVPRSYIAFVIPDLDENPDEFAVAALVAVTIDFFDLHFQKVFNNTGYRYTDFEMNDVNASLNGNFFISFNPVVFFNATPRFVLPEPAALFDVMAEADWSSYILDKVRRLSDFFPEIHSNPFQRNNQVSFRKVASLRYS